MKIKKFLIANGNSTLLGWDCPSWKRKKLIKKYLGEVEHLGFVSVKSGLPNLEMMGNELCINATLALASQLRREGELLTSGAEKPIFYKNLKYKTSIKISLSYKAINNIVILSGIGFIFLKSKIKSQKEFLSKLCKKFDLPAFGVIYLKENRIEPYVYVQETNTLVKETACGSGSIAFSILTGVKNVIQPTGKTIRVLRDKNQFTIEANVVTIR